MQDTPGTDVEGACERIKHHIQQQHRLRALDEDDPERDCATHLLPDTRVDVCIMLLPPHAAKADDLRLMVELAAVVPVIPVLSKVPSRRTVCPGPPSSARSASTCDVWRKKALETVCTEIQLHHCRDSVWLATCAAAVAQLAGAHALPCLVPELTQIRLLRAVGRCHDPCGAGAPEDAAAGPLVYSRRGWPASCVQLPRRSSGCSGVSRPPWAFRCGGWQRARPQRLFVRPTRTAAACSLACLFLVLNSKPSTLNPLTLPGARVPYGNALSALRMAWAGEKDADQVHQAV